MSSDRDIHIEVDLGTVVFVLCLFGLFVLCLGTPDLLDAIIHRLMAA